MTPLELALLYRIMIGLAGFSMGLATILCFANVKDALAGNREQWFWALVRVGYVAIIIVLLPLIMYARNHNSPFTWQSWLFETALLCEVVGFFGVYWYRVRNRTL